MTTPNANPDGQAPSDGTPAPTPPADTGINLSREEYSQLTAQLAVAQAQLERMQESQNRQQEPTPQPNPLANKDINTMTNAELVELMSSHINQSVAQPLLNTVMQLAIKEEMRDVQERYPDFKDFKKETYAIAEKNTHLSIEQAFLLAKAGKPATPAPPAKPTVTEDPTPTPPPQGEKPGVQSSSVQGESKMTARQAAEAAMKALKYN